MWPFGLHVYVFFSTFSFFFFFFQPAIVDFVNCEQCIYVLFTVPQITLFSNFFIKNGSHNTIYTFKNYFATVFSVSVFSFSKNKLNPNTPLVLSIVLSAKKFQFQLNELFSNGKSKKKKKKVKVCNYQQEDLRRTTRVTGLWNVKYNPRGKAQSMRI